MRLAWQRQPGPSAVPLEALPLPAALLDFDNQIVQTNPEWRRAYGDSIGNAGAWFDQQHPSAENRIAFAAGLEKLAAGQAAFVVDCGKHTVSGNACPNGTLLTVSNSPLTAADNERVAQAQKLETVGRLASGVAHDFANLLTLITGYSDLLLNRITEQDPLRAELDEIRNAANRGARLTSQLLGYTRGQTVQPRALDLNALIVDVERMLRPIIGENVEFETSLSGDLGKVFADPGQMEQVIMNLILNARDAMPTGGRISIETVNTSLDDAAARQHGMEPGACVLLSIIDNGHGIDQESIDHIFEPFFTTKAKGKGTGLGLSTVLSIIRETNGDIWVQSTLGRGAAFTICLPAVRKAAEVGEAAPGPRPVAAGSETVLLVEDEDSVRKLLSYVLNRRGYTVIEAASGEEALEIFQKLASEIHLVLTDMVMPKMSGRELSDRLRELRPELKVIYMSGYTDDVLVRTGALGPGMSFLQKPLRPDVLAAKVREALDSASRPFNPR